MWNSNVLFLFRLSNLIYAKYFYYHYTILFYQGKLPYFVAPPLEEDDDEAEQADVDFPKSDQVEGDEDPEVRRFIFVENRDFT